MNPKNIAIIAVAAVVIAGCLVVSFLNDDAPAHERDSEVGDSYSYLITHQLPGGDGINLIETDTVIGEYEDGRQVVLRTYDTGEEMMYSTDEGPYWTTQDMSGMEPSGTIAVDSPLYGAVECDVYADGTGHEVWIDSVRDVYVGERHTSPSGVQTTRLLMGTTSFDASPELPAEHSQGAETAEAGDYYAYLIDFHDGSTGRFWSFTDLLYVSSADGDTVTAGWLSGEATEMPLTDYLDNLNPEFADGTGTGTFLIDTVYGRIVCERHEYDRGDYTEVSLVGKEDGIVYLAQHAYDDGTLYTFDLIGSSVVSGPRDDPSDDRDLPQAGDRFGYLEYSVGEDFWAQYVEIVLTEEIGDMEFMAAVTIDGGEPETMVLPMHIDSGERIGTDVLMTPFGTIECGVYTYVTDDGVTVTYWDDGSGMTLQYRYDMGDSTMYRVLVMDSMTEPEVPRYDSGYMRDPQAGDRCTFVCTLEIDGDVTESVYTATVVSVDGDMLTVADEDGESETLKQKFYGYVPSDGSELVGQALIDTAYGLRLCDVYVETEDGLTSTSWVGADDGIEYRSVTEGDGYRAQFDLVLGTGVF